MLEQFQQLPKGMQIILAALTGTSLMGIAAMIDKRAVLLVVIGLALIAVAIFLWRLYQKWQAKKKAAALSGQLTTSASASPSSISDPASRAKLDDLRRNFGKGVEKFRAAGKDLYSLPWYIVCGEPGSGKTEAVRHCNVGFPPGLQDEMQGAGGTLNMHWWFTNQAVLLDTAGKLLFQEVPPGSTSEWTEFLQLLRKARPSVPVNGLLLVIPSESLIKDTFEDIQRKAGKIARQLDVIQKTLDVRFPVYVLITKCDLINGFREFFSGIKDPSLQHQMTGWANPDPLDAPFRPEAIEQHLGQVANRLSRRRLGLLRDPIPADATKRRIDEVDALFALPSAVSALSPRLRKYLETIFVAGEWSAKPLFLRGIFFTSALTEGAALDAELASALGLPVDSLPEGKAWERERSFFLRDLFVQKIFKEKGLVTRATNTAGLVRRRQYILGGVAVVGLLFVVVGSFLGRRALKTSVGNELALWRVGADAEQWNGDRWHPIVDSALTYVADDRVRLGDDRELSVIEYHEALQQQVTKDLHIPWIFKPVDAIAARANSNRRVAQRSLFEASVVSPLVAGTRERFLGSPQWTPADTARFGALVELEGAVRLRDVVGYVTDYPAEDFFDPLLGPSVAALPDGREIVGRVAKVYEWTYFRGGAGKGEWPGLWLGRGPTLLDNTPLSRGWDALEAAVKAAQTTQKEGFAVVSAGSRTVIRFLDSEKAFLAAASAPRSGGGWQSALIGAWTDLNSRRAAVAALVDDLKRKTGVTGSDITLDAGYAAVVARVRGELGRASQSIRGAMEKQKAAADAAAQATSGAASEFTLYRDLERRLRTLDTQVSQLLADALDTSAQAQLADLDLAALRPDAKGVALYEVRAAAYADTMAVVTADPAAAGSLLGRLAETVGAQATALAAVRERVTAYEGARDAEFTAGMQQLLEAATVTGVQGLLGAYRSELDRTFPPDAGFPLGTGSAMSAADLKAAAAALGRVQKDAQAESVPADARRALAPTFDRASALGSFATALLGSDGEPAAVKLVVVRERDQAAIVERVTGAPLAPGRALARVFPSVRIRGKDFRLRGLVENTDLGRYPLAEPLTLEFSTSVDPKPTPDATAQLGAWGPLRFLAAGAIRRAEGKEWDTVIRVPDSGTELFLAVTVVIEQPLPPLERWPAASPGAAK